MSDAEAASAYSPPTKPSLENTQKRPSRNDTSSTRTYSTRSWHASEDGSTVHDGRKPSTSTGITVITRDSSSDREDSGSDREFGDKAVLSPRASVVFSAPPEDSDPSDQTHEARAPGPPLGVDKDRDERLLRASESSRPDLTETQRKWLPYREDLEAAGYDLPRRYRAGYVPPGPSSDADAADDVLSRTHPSLIDATRRADGVRVVLKCVDTSAAAHQVGYVQRFNDVRRVNAPDNHCVRMYDVLVLPRLRALEGGAAVLVTPRLRRWDAPPLQTVGEAAALFAQLAEGLRYMHRHNTAYNAKLSGSTLYGPVHMPWRTGPKYGRSRALDPPKYYFCDFADAQTFREMPVDGLTDDVPRSPLETQGEAVRGVDAQDVDAAAIQPYPFAQDVYNLADFFSKEFTLCYAGFAWLQPLLDAMLAPDPSARPSMDAAIARFAAARRAVPWRTLRSRLVLKHAPHSPARLAHKLRHVVRSVGWLVCGAPAAPRAYCERELELERVREMSGSSSGRVAGADAGEVP